MKTFYAVVALNCLLGCCLRVEAEGDHPGQMKPLGVGLNAEHVEIRKDLPDPIEFYDTYVYPSVPVLLKGVAKSFPGYEKLRNDSYLRDAHGKWKVVYEPNLMEIRDKIERRTSFRNFIDSYVKDGRMYMVSDIVSPNPIREIIAVPKPMLCDDITKRIESVTTWLSNGGTWSLLHTDTVDNLNCIYDGHKDVWFAHYKHWDNFYFDKDGKSKIDVQKVDYKKFPKILDIPWKYAKAEAGDCLFIPFNWPHHIVSHGPRSFAVNMFWTHMRFLPNREECEARVRSNSMPDMEPLANHTVLTPLEIGKNQLLGRLQSYGKKITERQFFEEFENGNAREEDMEQLDQLWSRLDEDRDGSVELKDLLKVDTEELKPFIEDFQEEEGGGDRQPQPYEEVGSHDEL